MASQPMKLVQSLNKSLQYQNGHQKCVLEMKEADLVKLKQKLLDMQVKVKVEPSKVQEREEELQGEVKRLKNLVTKLEEDNCSLDKDKDSWKEKYWDSLKKLDESHRLINVHLHNAAEYRDDCNDIEKLQKATQDMLDETKYDLKQSRGEQEQLVQKHKEEVESFDAETSKLNAQILDLNAQVQDLSAEKEGMEKSLRKADENILDLDKELTDVKAILNVEKFHQETQTDLQMLNMLQREVQATPLLQNQEIQIEVDTAIGVTQTIDPAIRSTEVQTDVVVTIATNIQTEPELEYMKKMENAVTQTELGAMEYDRLLYAEKTDEGRDQRGNSTGSGHVQGKYENSSESEKAVGLKKTTNHNHDNSTTANTEETNVTRYKTQGHHGIHQETVEMQFSKLKGIEFESKGNIGKEVDSNRESRDNEDHRVINESIDHDNIAEIKSSSVGKFWNTSDSNEDCGMDRDNSTDNNKEDENVRRLKLFEEKTNVPDDEMKIVGLRIPKIDIERNVDRDRIVPVDPEEFGIELTQEDRTVNENSKQASKQTYFNRSGQSYPVNSYALEEILHGLPKSKIDSELFTGKKAFDKSIEKNWTVSEAAGTMTKSKTKKHKLTKEIVNDEFSNFDVNKEKFAKLWNKDEVQPKQPKLMRMVGYQNRGLPRKQRNYSSMFQVEENKRVDGSDTEDMLPQTDPAIIAEQMCCSTNTMSMECASEYCVTIDSCYKNKALTDKPGSEASTQLSKGIMCQSPEAQSSLQADNQSDNGNQKETDHHLAKIYMHSTPKLLNKVNENLAANIVRPAKFSKPLSGTLESKYLNPTDSANLTMQLENSSPHLKEAVIEIPSVDEDKPGLYSTPCTISNSSKAVISDSCTEEEKLSIDQASVVTRSAYERTSYDRPETAMQKSVSTASVCGSGRFPRLSESANSEIGYATTGIDNVQTASSVSSSASSTGQPTVTATQSKPKTSDPPAKKESSSDFLQKYRDIVAKIKPFEHNTGQQAKEALTTRHPKTSPRNFSLPDFNRKVSPRGRTPKGILKGTREKNRKSRNVTWNEYALNQDSAQDEKTPEDK